MVVVQLQNLNRGL